MSGSDSESIYETVRVFVPKRQCKILFHNFLTLFYIYTAGILLTK